MVKAAGYSKPHWSFWVIGVVALVWNVAGAANFVVQFINAGALDAYRESERAIIEDRPLWTTVAFGLAVFGGSLGCVLLLLRKPAAFYLFAISFIGVTGTVAHAMALGITFHPGELVGIIVMPLALAAFLLWYARFCQRKHWVAGRG